MSKHTLSPVIIAGFVVVLIGAGVIAFNIPRNTADQQVATEKQSTSTPSPSSTMVTSAQTPSPTPTPVAPTIKHIGINLDYYNEATGKAGDLQFTKKTFASGSHMQLLFSEFGYEIPGNSATGGVAKRNVQPTFIAPLGTKVHSLVDGEVINVPKLYSNDYSVMVKADGSNLIFETEHVKNVQVKQGDKVTAGQVVAEVSDYDAKNFAGFGLFEIGVLDGGSGGLPHHLCPFSFLDPSIKEEINLKIEDLKTSWESYRGNSAIYDESKSVIPGCLTTEPIEG